MIITAVQVSHGKELGFYCFCAGCGLLSQTEDPVKGQKKLIIDEAIVTPKAVFDYGLTASQPMSLTLDGGMDGFSHCIEVYLGAKGEGVERIEKIALAVIELIVSGLDKIHTAGKDPQIENKLQNIPVPLTTDLVDQFMGPVLEAARSGNLGKIVLRN